MVSSYSYVVQPYDSPHYFFVESSPDSPDFNIRPDLKETSPGVSVTGKTWSKKNTESSKKK